MTTGSLSADTWTKVTKTIPGNSNLQFDDDANAGLTLFINAFVGTDYTTGGLAQNAWSAWSSAKQGDNMTSTWYTTNNATLEITGLQLEVGSVATDFEHRSFAVEERLCKRYFNKYIGPVQINFVNEHPNNKSGYLYFPYEEVMRAAPTVTFGSNVTIGRPQTSVSQLITTAGNIGNRSLNYVGWPSSSTLGSTGDAYYRMILIENDANSTISCDAEL
jgi:hypothetical protein